MLEVAGNGPGRVRGRELLLDPDLVRARPADPRPCISGQATRPCSTAKFWTDAAGDCQSRQLRALIRGPAERPDVPARELVGAWVASDPHEVLPPFERVWSRRKDDGCAVVCQAERGGARVCEFSWPLRERVGLTGGRRACVKALAITAEKGEAAVAITQAKVRPIVGAEVTLHYRVPDRRRHDA
jgi:hypothetical protein